MLSRVKEFVMADKLDRVLLYETFFLHASESVCDIEDNYGHSRDIGRHIHKYCLQGFALKMNPYTHKKPEPQSRDCDECDYEFNSVRMK
jgi:hypothetical protein